MRRRNRLLLGVAVLLILGEAGLGAGVLRTAASEVAMTAVLPETVVRRQPRDDAPVAGRVSPGTRVVGTSPRFWSTPGWIELLDPRGYTRGPLALGRLSPQPMFSSAFAGAAERTGPGAQFGIKKRYPYAAAVGAAVLGKESLAGPAAPLAGWAVVVRGGAVAGYVDERELARDRPEVPSALAASVARLREGRYREGLGIAIAAAGVREDEDAPRLAKLRDALAYAAGRLPFPAERPEVTVAETGAGRPYEPQKAKGAYAPAFIASTFAALRPAPPPDPARGDPPPAPAAWLPLNAQVAVLEVSGGMARVALEPAPPAILFAADASAAGPDAPPAQRTFLAGQPPHRAPVKGGRIAGWVALGALAASPIDQGEVLRAVYGKGARDPAAAFALAEAFDWGAPVVAAQRFGAATGRDELELARAALILAGQGSRVGGYRLDGLEVRPSCTMEDHPPPACARAEPVPEAMRAQHLGPGTYLHARLRNGGGPAVRPSSLTLFSVREGGPCAFGEAQGDPELARVELPELEAGASIDLWVRLPAERIREAGLVSGTALEVQASVAQHLGRETKGAYPVPGVLRTLFFPGCGVPE